ncbi:unnamed protein product [Thelazia callipaeda]|uniref:CST complex subunit CTC1 n=1 Tax=Thelazia callipaeda TaxID=103827 RepID=A0A158RC81_THECL|nr:unnamed protein product [Thelazia callipaeda]
MHLLDIIFLIDHAWTFHPQIARKQLNEVPGLLDWARRLRPQQTHSDYEGSDDEVQTSCKINIINENVLNSMKHRVNFEKHHLKAYLHGEKPNECDLRCSICRMNLAFALITVSHNCRTFSIAELVTRDTMILRNKPNWRKVLMLPWTPADLAGKKIVCIVAPKSHFTRGGLLDILLINAPFAVLVLICFQERLLYDKNPKAVVNQFPYDGWVLTIKGATVRHKYREIGNFMGPITLKAFCVQLFLKFKLTKDCLMLRGNFHLDTHVTDNISYIIRLIESGLKIVTNISLFCDTFINCKYIHQPVCSQRRDNGNMVKFDLHYALFLCSLRPLKLSLYKNFLYDLLYSGLEFFACELDDYDTQLTVFSYIDKNKILNESCIFFISGQLDLVMDCNSFIRRWEKLYCIKWDGVQMKINGVTVFSLALLTNVRPSSFSEKAPCGITADGQSGAINQKILHLATRKRCVSFIERDLLSDCSQACEFYTHFADTTFKALFTYEDISDKPPLNFIFAQMNSFQCLAPADT